MKFVASAVLLALCVSVLPISSSHAAVGAQKSQDTIEKKKKKKKKKHSAPAPAPAEPNERMSSVDDLI